MIAYKFLGPGATGPFTGFAWPVPSGSAPGPWVAAAPGGSRGRWIHACRTGDLPHWIGEELWRVELGSPTHESAYQVAAPRARLLHRMQGWGPELRRRYAVACAWRARDLAADALAGALPVDAASLRACTELESLRQATVSAAAERLAGYVRDAAARALSGKAASASFIVTALAAEIAGAPAAALPERAWQARWLALQLELPAS